MGFCHRLAGFPAGEAECGCRDCAKRARGDRNGNEERAEPAAKRCDDEPADGGGDDQPDRPRQHGPQHAAGALPREVEQHAKPEETVKRRDDAQVERPCRQDGWVGREEPEPGAGEYCDSQADRLGEPSGQKGTDPRDPFSARKLAGANIDADHGEGGGAEPEEQRDEEVIQPRGNAVARDRPGTEQANRTGDQHDGEVGLD